MLSIWIFLISCPITVFLSGGAIALGARWLGSARRGLLPGIGTVVLLAVCVVPIAVAQSIVAPSLNRLAAAGTALAALGLQVLVTFAVFKWMYHLRTGRTWALIGIYVSLGIGWTVVAVVVLRPFIVEAFRATAASMNPTIVPGDRFVVNKLIHPRRWDIVAFRHSEPNGVYVYCKRLVGLPGERLRFEDGEVYVNDQKMAAPAVVAGRYHASPFENPNIPRKYKDGDTITLREHDFFVVGDNVHVSADSRIWGPVDEGALVGVVDLKYWPLNQMAIYR